MDGVAVELAREVFAEYHNFLSFFVSACFYSNRCIERILPIRRSRGSGLTFPRCSEPCFRFRSYVRMQRGLTTRQWVNLSFATTREGFDGAIRFVLERAGTPPEKEVLV